MKRLFPSSLFFACALQILAQPSGDFTASVQKNFARWDLNHDGILSPTELAAAVADPQTTNENAAAVAAVKRAARVAKNPLPPLTLENIASLAAQRRPDLARMFREGLKRISSVTNRVMFAENFPKLETIHQGELGNCFCLAPLGAMVHRDPAQVAEMFSLQGNGDYSVRLGKQMVEIAPPTDAEIAMSSSNERDGIWVNIYEKAVGTARNDAKPEEQRADSPLDALARGGSAGTMLAFITGHDIVRFSFKFAKDPAPSTAEFNAKLADLRSQLATATAKKVLMTCGTLKVTTPGLMPNHAYAVLNYDTDTDAVELWNPHGEDFLPKGTPGADNGYATTKGVFRIPLAQFIRQFSGMAFEVAGGKFRARSTKSLFPLAVH